MRCVGLPALAFLSPLLRLDDQLLVRESPTFRTRIVMYYFHTPCAKCHFAHARVKQRALNQTLHMSYEKIVFDTRVRK